MAEGFGTAALRRWAAFAQTRATGSRSRSRPDAHHLPLPHDPAAGVPDHPLGGRLAGAPEAVTRLATVRPGTVAVLLPVRGPVQVRHPGDLVVPPLLHRGSAPLRALALSTDPVHVDLETRGLVTLDGFTVEVVRLRLELQLDAGDGYRAVAELAAVHGAALDAVLLEQVRRETAAGLQGAVTMNRRADLQRLTLRRVLTERWLAPTLAGGTLRRRDVQVLEAGHASPEDELTVQLPDLTGVGLDEATGDIAPMASAT